MEDKNVIEVKPSYASEVQRALVTLGFSESERGLGRGLKTFSRWVDQLQILPDVSEELKATWTQFMVAWFGTKESYRGKEQIEHAAESAWHAITLQLRYFPPRALKEYGDDQSYAAGWTELSAWRVAAKANGFDSPEDLSSVQGSTFGQFADKRIVKEWRDETGEESPKLAGQRIASLVNDVHRQSQRIQALLDERELWREKTTCQHPKEFISTEKEWQNATHCQSPEDFETTMVQWSIDSGCANPRMATLELDRLREEVGLQLKKIEGLSEQLHERDQDLLTANAEIDRVKKAAQTLGLSADGSDLVKSIRESFGKNELGHEIGIDLIPSAIKSVVSELAKVRAELQTKYREAQTEKERAERAESASNARGVLLEKIGEALQLNTTVLWDPLPGQVAYVVEQRKFEKMRADAAEIRYADRVFSSEDLAQETNEIIEILTSQLKDAGIVSAAQSIACRTASLSKAHTLTMEARKMLGAKAGEKISDAAKRVMSTVIIPLPKPEATDMGQVWAFKVKIPLKDSPHRSLSFGTSADLLGSDYWIYLGKS